jgi:hypothetical protein
MDFAADVLIGIARARNAFCALTFSAKSCGEFQNL